MNGKSGSILIIGLMLLIGGTVHLIAQDQIPQEPDISLAGGISALCPTTEEYSLSRPDADAGPTSVKLGVYILDITEIDDVRQFFTADVYFISQWKDPRLANPGRGDTTAICTLPRDRVWHPSAQFDRIRSFDQYYPDITMIDAEGKITRVQRYSIDVSMKLNLEDFPFDKHALVLSADPLVSSTEEVVFEVLETLTGRADVLSLNGWKIGTPHAETRNEYAPARGITVSKYILSLDVEREWGFYVWRTIVPLFFIVFMSWAVFWIPPAQFVRIGLSATSMLTLIAYQFAFSNLLPRISYLTRSDRFGTCSSILIFLALVEAIFTSALAHHEKNELATSIDRLARWVFPMAYIGVILFAFVF